MEASESIIEGVGDELLWTFLSLFILLLSVSYLMFCSNSRRRDNVHPEQEGLVERVREQLRDNQQGEADQQQDRIEDEGYDPDNAELPQCPVCLGPIVYIVETNCGHRFCAQCILMYWRTDRWPRACRCPVCRREVNILLTLPQMEANERYQDLTNQIRDYNTRMSGEWRPLMSYIYDIPTLLRYLLRDLFTVNGLICMHRLHILAIFVLLLLYLFIPFDLLPESAIGLIGFIDDGLILLTVVIYVTLLYRSYVTNRAMNQ